eukprot:1483606-Amphidinium_carterae.2
MAQLMSDTRLMQQVDVFASLLEEKCNFLEHLTAAFWHRLAAAIDIKPSVLRDLVIRGSHTMRGYIDLKIFSVVSDYPWCLAVGNLSDNVAGLAEQEEPPADQVAFKLWTLLSIGMSRAEVQKVLLLLSSCSCTSYFTEKQHASTSLVRRHHDYAISSLVCRAYMHTLSNLQPSISGFGCLLPCKKQLLETFEASPGLRQLLPSGAREEKELSQLRISISKLLATNVNYITGRQLFLSTLMQQRRSGLPHIRMHCMSRQDIMAEHGQVWNSLTQARRNYYEERANEVRRQKQASLDESLALTTAKLRDNCAAPSSSQDRAGSMKISLANFTAQDLQQLQKLYDSKIFNKSTLQEKRRQALTCPLPLSQERFDQV